MDLNLINVRITHGKAKDAEYAVISNNRDSSYFEASPIFEFFYRLAKFHKNGNQKIHLDANQDGLLAAFIKN